MLRCLLLSRQCFGQLHLAFSFLRLLELALRFLLFHLVRTCAHFCLQRRCLSTRNAVLRRLNGQLLLKLRLLRASCLPRLLHQLRRRFLRHGGGHVERGTLLPLDLRDAALLLELELQPLHRRALLRQLLGQLPLPFRRLLLRCLLLVPCQLLGACACLSRQSRSLAEGRTLLFRLLGQLLF